jgi:hypothetical protein
MEELGVIYVAMGAPYLAMALTSIASLRVFNPATPVCVVTNVSKGPPRLPWINTAQDLKWINVDEVTLRNRFVKLDMYGYSPFRKTLYLDCDTLVLSDISKMAFFLDYFDLALTPVDHGPEIDAKRMLFDGTVRLGDISHFNGGVIGFKKNQRVEQFFDYWRTRYSSLRFKRDQPSLLEAFYQSDVRLLPLAQRWNRGDRPYSDSRTRRDIVVWHYKVRMDKNLESYIWQMLKVFSDDPNDIDAVEAFIKNRRKSRGYAKSPEWLLKSLVIGMRGSLSKRPERYAGRENWKRLFAS